MSILEQLEPQKYISVETYKKNSEAVRTPVWFVIKDNLVYVVTRDQTGKVKRLKNNQKVKIASCKIKGEVTGKWVKGTAKILGADETVEIVKLRDKKYGFFSRVARFLTKGKGELVAFSIMLE